MRSVRFDRFGDPAQVLTVEDRARPEPKPGSVLVRMSARALDPADLMVIQGLYGKLPELPASPGLEGVGGHEQVGVQGKLGQSAVGAQRIKTGGLLIYL